MVINSRLNCAANKTITVLFTVYFLCINLIDANRMLQCITLFNEIIIEWVENNHCA